MNAEHFTKTVVTFSQGDIEQALVDYANKHGRDIPTILPMSCKFAYKLCRRYSEHTVKLTCETHDLETAASDTTTTTNDGA